MMRLAWLAALVGYVTVGGFCAGQPLKGEKTQHPQPSKGKDALGDLLPSDAFQRLGTRRFRDSTSGLFSVAISPDGKHLLTGPRSRAPIRLWDLATGRQLCDLDSQGVSVFAVAFSQDGKRMVAGAGGGRHLLIWDLETRKKQSLRSENLERGLYGGLYSVVFSPTGKLLATGAAATYPLELWDVEKGEVIESFDGYSDETVYGVDFSPDGKLLASGGGRYDIKGRVRIWDVAARKQVTELKGLRDCIRGIAFSPDGKLLATACHDKRLILWDVATWKVVRVIEADSSTTAVAFSKDSKWLAFASFHQIYLCDPTKGQVWRRIGCSCGSLNTLVFTPDGKTLFGTGSDNTIRRWDVATGEVIHAAPGHEATVTTLRYSPDGSILASFGSNSELRLWDAQTGKSLHRFPLHPEGGGGVDERRQHDRPIVFSPDGKTVYGRCHKPDEMVQGWDVTSGKKRSSAFAKPHFFHFFDLSPDGRTLMVPAHDRICFWSIEAKKELPAIEAPPPGQINSSQTLYLPDGQTLLCARMFEVLLVDARDGAVLGQLETKKAKKPRPGTPSNAQLHRLILSSDKRLLAAVEYAQTNEEGNAVFVWEIATGKMLGRFAVAAPKGKGTAEQHDGAVCTVAFSPDGRLLVTTGLFDKTLRLWDVRTGKHLHCFKGHDGGVTSVDFHPDGKTLASGSTDTTILLWDVSTYYPPLGDAPAPEKLPALWDDLANADPHTAFKAADSLVAARDKTVTLLAARLQPVAKPDATTIQRLLDDLEARDFKVREKAGQDLARLGPVVEPELRRKLKDKPSLDLERRLQALLRDMRPWIRDPDTLRSVRAVAVLERIGSPDAVALLKKLAAGAEAATLTREARAAVERHRRLQRR